MSDEISLYSAIGEGGSLSGFDMELLRMATKRMSGEQMYEELDRPPSLTPARCIQRVKEIVRAQDYLTAHEQKALLLLDIVRLRDLLWERLEEGTEVKMTKHGDMIDVGLGSSYYNAMARVLKQWQSTIESMGKDVEREEVTIREIYRDAMMAMISTMFDAFVLRLGQHVDMYGEMPGTKEMRDLFEEVVPLGFAAIETKAA